MGEYLLDDGEADTMDPVDDGRLMATEEPEDRDEEQDEVGCCGDVDIDSTLE